MEDYEVERLKTLAKHRDALALADIQRYEYLKRKQEMEDFQNRQHAK